MGNLFYDEPRPVWNGVRGKALGIFDMNEKEVHVGDLIVHRRDGIWMGVRYRVKGLRYGHAFGPIELMPNRISDYEVGQEIQMRSYRGAIVDG